GDVSLTSGPYTEVSIDAPKLVVAVFSREDFDEELPEAGTLNDGAFQSEGVQPTSSAFNDSVTKAIWQFDDVAIAQGDQSWYLFLYSDYDWIAGDIEVRGGY
ncbi:MAG: hypothetical protein ACYSOV_03270, partial [Planctomycetota bacterium]